MSDRCDSGSMENAAAPSPDQTKPSRVRCAICKKVDNNHRPDGTAYDGSHMFLSERGAQSANTADSPPQIVSAPLSAEKKDAWDIAYPWAEDGGQAAQLAAEIEAYAREYASTSNAALQQQLDQARKERDETDMSWSVRYDQEVGHLQRVSQGYVLRMEQAEQKSERWADCAAKTGQLVVKAECEIHMLERAAESHKYTVSDLVAEGDGLREALREQKRNAVEIIRLRQKDIDPNSINISPEWVVTECNEALGTVEARLSGTEKGTK